VITTTALLLHLFNALFPIFQDNLGKLAPERQTILDFTGEKDDGISISWTISICKSFAPRELQTDNHASTSPLSFYRPDAHPAAQPTVSKHRMITLNQNDL